MLAGLGGVVQRILLRDTEERYLSQLEQGWRERASFEDLVLIS